MTTQSPRSILWQAARTLPALALLGASLALGACSSAAAIGNPGGRLPVPCITGTIQQLAGPTAGQAAVPTTVGQVILVAYGNGNTLYNTYTQWQTTLVDNLGMPTPGGQLRLVSDATGPHPYPSDFYYGSTLPQLVAGRTYAVYLSMTNGSCQPISLSSFST